MTFCTRCCCLHSAVKPQTKAFSIQITPLAAVAKLLETLNSTLWNPSRTSTSGKYRPTCVCHSLLLTRTSIISPLFVICSCCLRFTFFLPSPGSCSESFHWAQINHSKVYTTGQSVCVVENFAFLLV